MGAQEPANTRVWGAPFHAEIEWKWRFEVYLYVLNYIYFSYHNSTDRPRADITAQSLTPSFASHSCDHRTQEHEPDEKETLSLLCELGTGRNQSEHRSWLLLFPEDWRRATQCSPYLLLPENPEQWSRALHHWTWLLKALCWVKRELDISNELEKLI